MRGPFLLRVDGEVGGKGRPRTRIATIGGRPVAMIYPDPKSAKPERLIKGLAFAAMSGKPKFGGAVSLRVDVWLSPPKSWPKYKREAAYYVTGKPDADNILKLIADSLNKIVWEDDAQVADMEIHRRYSLEIPPHVDISVHALERTVPRDLAREASPMA